MNFLSRHFDELAVGDRFVSRGRTITEADIVSWCALTGDWHVLHSNAHYAAETRFGQRIAPGLLIFAYAAGLGVPADAPGIIANYGTDRLRFMVPTFIGDTLHLESHVKHKAVRKEGADGLVTLDWNMVNQNAVTVMASDLQVLMSFKGARN